LSRLDILCGTAAVAGILVASPALQALAALGLFATTETRLRGTVWTRRAACVSRLCRDVVLLAAAAYIVGTALLTVGVPQDQALATLLVQVGLGASVAAWLLVGAGRESADARGRLLCAELTMAGCAVAIVAVVSAAGLGQIDGVLGLLIALRAVAYCIDDRLRDALIE
jgi:hypothetical protein